MPRKKQTEPRALQRIDCILGITQDFMNDKENNPNKLVINGERLNHNNMSIINHCIEPATIAKISPSCTNFQIDSNSGLEEIQINEDFYEEAETNCIEEDDNSEDGSKCDSFYSDIDSSNTSPSYSPSLPDMASTPNFEVDNILNINNNNKITTKQHNSEHSLNVNGGINENILSALNEKQGAEITTSTMKDVQRTPSDTGVALSASSGTAKPSKAHSERPTLMSTKSKGEGSRLGKYGKINGTASQLPSNATNNTIEGSYQCQFCDKSFPRLGYLKKHEQSHAEHMPFKCEYCARLFKHKRSRDRHTKLHTGDRRYRCPHCESAFSRSDHLKIHMKTHDNQKPFQCTVCNRGYNTAAALTSHMQSHKKQAALQRSNTLNYSPRSTGSGSSCSSIYKRKYSPHMDQRDSSNPLLTVNAKRFAYHNNNAMLYCVYCTKNDFDNLEQLHAHVQQMHAIVLREITENPFSGIHPGLNLSCEFCTMKFPSISSMFQHIRAMHIDRISNPSTYIEQISRRATTAEQPTDHFCRKPVDRFAHPLGYIKPDDIRIKGETNLTRADRKTSNNSMKENDVTAKENQNGDIKQEDLPTDLSNKRTEAKGLDKGEMPDNVAIQNDDMIDHNGSHKELQKSDQLRCNQCNLILPNIEVFRDHFRNHLIRGELKNLVCFQCGMSFIHQNEYEQHVSSHFLISTTEYTCSFGCNKHFVNSEAMQNHLFDMHAQNVWKCGICFELFESKVAIQIHFAVTHSNKENSFRCSACMEVFETDVEFKNHVREKHSLMFSLPNLQCPLCRTVCSSEIEMHFHMATHRQYRCTICPEVFNMEFLLEQHMQIQHSMPEKTSLSSYKIDSLNNNMFDYSYAAAAKKIYSFGAASGHSKLFESLPITSSTSASPLKLPAPLYELYDNIGKTFSQQNLTKHFSNISKTFSEHFDQTQSFSKHFSDYSADIPQFMNLYKTDLASKTFLRSNPLAFLRPKSTEAHCDTAGELFAEKKKLSDPQFTCTICERNDFQSDLEMRAHQKIAHNLKTGVSLMCAYCNENFRSRNELENHMKTVHMGGRHKCLICDEVFSSADILAEHKLNHSKIGIRGKCTYCSANLVDLQDFKAHMTEHGNSDLPAQCICCRQTIGTVFELELHAKFHANSSSTDVLEQNCALCLTALPAKYDSKVCQKCNEKYASYSLSMETEHCGSATSTKSNIVEPSPNSQYCNLCKKSFPRASELEEHLIEHSFRGCEERGYNCYICSAIFTLPSGLHQHMIEHGPSYRPYDCNLCSSKFYFRAELENHLIDHETGRRGTQTHTDNQPNGVNGLKQLILKQEQNQINESNNDAVTEKEETRDTAIKLEDHHCSIGENTDEDDEYIEVEKIGDSTAVDVDSNDGIDEQRYEKEGANDDI